MGPRNIRSLDKGGKTRLQFVVMLSLRDIWRVEGPERYGSHVTLLPGSYCDELRTVEGIRLSSTAECLIAGSQVIHFLSCVWYLHICVMHVNRKTEHSNS